jgi:hypothetical protein
MFKQPKTSVLNTKIKVLHDECDHYLDDRAAEIKNKDAQNLPFDAIRGVLTRSDCRCMALLRLLAEEKENAEKQKATTA